jgi:hypothetical protein
MKNKYFIFISALFVSTLAVPAKAQFLVYNPLEQIQLVYENGTLAEQVAVSLKLLQLATQEATALHHKQYMLAATYLSNFARFGVTGHTDWNIAMTTGGVIAAGTVWREMTTPGGLQFASIQNRVALADAMGPSMIDALGGCNAAMIQTNGAIGQLEMASFSSATADNSTDSLGGQSSVGLTQQLRIQQCQQNLQQQQAQLQLLDALRHRDYENAQYSTYQNIDAIANANPAGIVNIGGLNTADFN